MASLDNSIDFDLSKFQEYNVSKCNGNDYKKCEIMNRLLAALTYYSKLNIVDNQQHIDLLSDFMNNLYGSQLLNDYNHFLGVHRDELEHINEGLLDGAECDLSSCRHSNRHHKTINNENNKAALDPKLKFYVETMDSLHFYVSHLFQTGMRSIKMSGDKKENDDDDKKHGQYFDAVFARITSGILKRQHRTKKYQRFNTQNNAKFNIKTGIEQKIENDDITFLEAMYKHLEGAELAEIDIIKLRQFVFSQEYEAETLGTSNLAEDITFHLTLWQFPNPYG